MLEWPTILEAIGLAQTGDRTTGRQALLACWEQTGPTEHAFRCEWQVALETQLSAREDFREELCVHGVLVLRPRRDSVSTGRG